jgi:hypothetical protein
MLGVLLLAACGGEKPPRGVTRVAPKYAPSKATPQALKAQADSPFDAEGKLRGSGKTLGWLELPMGLTEQNNHGAHHAYTTPVPMSALTAYFDARVFTGQVELVSGGVHYRGAEPKGGKSRGMRFDIALYPNRYDGRVRMTIDELPAAASAPLSVSDAKGLLRQQQERAE